MDSSFRAQESFRTAKGDEEVSLYNIKKRRVTHASFRVGWFFLMNCIMVINVSTEWTSLRWDDFAHRMILTRKDHVSNVRSHANVRKTSSVKRVWLKSTSSTRVRKGRRQHLLRLSVCSFIFYNSVISDMSIMCVYVLLVQDSEMEGSDVNLSNEDEEEWRSDSSRYSCCHHNCFKNGSV